MTLTLGDAAHPTGDTSATLPSAHDTSNEFPPSQARTDEVVHRSGRKARMALIAALIVGVVGIVVVVLSGLVAAGNRTEDVASAHDHARGEGDDDVTHHGGYETQPATVAPPLPGVQPGARFDPRTAVANFDASVVAEVEDGALVFTESNGAGGGDRVDLPPGYELRALSATGTTAALVRHEIDEAGRVTRSDVLIADRSSTKADPDSNDPVTVTIHHLDGLVEPEAFATDGRSLFVIDHQAGSRPGTYRIRPLDLATGELQEMLGPTKEPLIEDMNGVGRRQVWGLNDSRLYTLYIRQTDHVHASGRSGTDGFVHILDLDEEWAFCLDLPSSFGKGDLSTTALAVGATRLAVLDLSAGVGGQLAYASIADRAVVDVLDLPLSFRRTVKAMLVAAAEQPGRPAGWQPTVHLAMHETVLAVGVGDALVWFDGSTLEPLVDDPDNAYRDRVELDGPLLGLTTMPGSGVLAWTGAGQGPEQLSPPRH
ncbi:MAG: hypothetical protein OES24_17860 [Acidimicrobiia bacterium]|nr:hypothetical protein [Acidimicrobiia bacterium]